jgi:outer membrane protein assembly factor BamB
LVLLDSQDTEYDFCVVKLDSSGNEIWTSTFDSGENDFGSGIAVDSQDNIVVAGNVYGSGHRDGALALANYDSNGNLVWSKALTGFFRISEIVADEENNVILCGITSTNATDIDYYVAKIDISGNLIWQQTFSSNGEKPDNGCGVALDLRGNMIVTGDRFMIKLDPNGSKLWLRHFTGRDVLVDPNGTIVAIDGSCVEVFDPSGVFLGQTTFADDLLSLVFDLEGNLVIVGTKSMYNLSYRIPEPSPYNNSAQPDAFGTEVPVVTSASSIAVIAFASSLLYLKKRQKSCG